MQKKYDTTVLGLVVLDILGRPVTKIPDGGNLAYIDELRLTVAGTAGGTVIDCAKLGVSTLGVGAVGDDEKADFVISTLEKFGVDTIGFERLKGVPTSSTILNIRPNGERPALHLRGACDYFLPPEKEKVDIYDCKVFHLGGTGLLKKLDGPVSVDILKEAKNRGCITTWDLIGATEETANIVNRAIDGKKKVCAVGTTSMRSIESSVSAAGRLKGNEAWTDKFIFPPYDFRIANALITNFHTPESTLLMMTSAFGGYDAIMAAYEEAVKEKYRFFSYGDAMLII